MPSSPSRSLNHWLFVSSRWPLVSSSPMEMTSACMKADFGSFNTKVHPGGACKLPSFVPSTHYSVLRTLELTWQFVDRGLIYYRIGSFALRRNSPTATGVYTFMQLRRPQLLIFALLAVAASVSSGLVVPTRAVGQSYNRESRSEGEGRDRFRRDRGGEGYRDWRSRGRDDERRS